MIAQLPKKQADELPYYVDQADAFNASRHQHGYIHAGREEIVRNWTPEARTERSQMEFSVITGKANSDLEEAYQAKMDSTTQLQTYQYHSIHA